MGKTTRPGSEPEGRTDERSASNLGQTLDATERIGQRLMESEDFAGSCEREARELAAYLEEAAPALDLTPEGAARGMIALGLGQASAGNLGAYLHAVDVGRVEMHVRAYHEHTEDGPWYGARRVVAKPAYVRGCEIGPFTSPQQATQLLHELAGLTPAWPTPESVIRAIEKRTGLEAERPELTTREEIERRYLHQSLGCMLDEAANGSMLGPIARDAHGFGQYPRARGLQGCPERR